MKAGDVVRLKSGGPVMTVRVHASGPGSAGEVICVWFSQNNFSSEQTLKTEQFSEASLVLVEEPKS